MTMCPMINNKFLPHVPYNLPFRTPFNSETTFWNRQEAREEQWTAAMIEKVNIIFSRMPDSCNFK